LKILVSGSTGFVGSALVQALKLRKHEVVSLVRRSSQDPAAIFWDPAQKKIDRERLEGFDAVFHLAGESIAAGRWTQERKRRIRDSRVTGAGLLAESLAQLKRPPRTLVSASAIGYYGNRGSELLTEESTAGHDFLADVCVEWERAAAQADKAGLRVVHTRFGIILGRDGGALKKMITPFKLGVGGRLGDGGQYMSWITRDDVIDILQHTLENDKLSGAVNVVAPQPVTNSEFTNSLGRVLHRPTVLPMPAFAVRMFFGEMGDALLLSSAHVRPSKLISAGYRFKDPELEAALTRILKS